MDPKRALIIALHFLDAFEQAGSIYEDYIAHENIMDDDYQSMLAELRALLAREEATAEAQKPKKGSP